MVGGEEKEVNIRLFSQIIINLFFCIKDLNNSSVPLCAGSPNPAQKKYKLIFRTPLSLCAESPDQFLEIPFPERN
jgi:hypothetical protein